MTEIEPSEPNDEYAKLYEWYSRGNIHKQIQRGIDIAMSTPKGDPSAYQFQQEFQCVPPRPEPPPCPVGRRSGRTQWMIERLVDAIEDGQPKARVIGHTYSFAVDHLKPMFINELEKRGIRYDLIRRDRVHVGEAVIMFFGGTGTDKRNENGFGYFVDHVADGEW